MSPIETRLIYVASPYSSPDKEIEHKRSIEVAIAMGFLMNEFPQLAFFSPICHSHLIAMLGELRGDWEYWKQYDEAMISRSDELWVLCLDGWKTSTGVTAELAFSKELTLPIKYILPREGYKVVNESPSF